MGLEPPVLVDVSNATRAVVRGLNYRLFRDGQPALTVACASATVSHSTSQATLRGRVTIQVADGSRLVSNLVLWDLDSNRFIVPGTYMLNRNGTWIKGERITCDDRLRVPLHHAVSDAREEPVYRLRSRENGTHLYAMNPMEMQGDLAGDPQAWTADGIAYYAYREGCQPMEARPVYRFQSRDRRSFFFTIHESERDRVLRFHASSWRCEGIAFYAFPEAYCPPGTEPVYRLWSGRLDAHLYTMFDTERDELLADPSGAWHDEGIAWRTYRSGQYQTFGRITEESSMAGGRPILADPAVDIINTSEGEENG
jgi:hypothetical protein